MTTQSPPSAVVFDKGDWLLLGNEYTLKNVAEAFPVADPGSIFDAKAFGFRPPLIPRSTGCWDGFIFGVSIDERGLLLKTVELSQDHGVPYPIINGVRPSISENFFEAKYDAIDLRLDFTGTLRVCRDYDKSLPRPMYGLQPYLFRTVLDVQFDGGNLVSIANRSAHVENFRAMNGERIKEEHDRSSLPSLGFGE